MKQHTLSEPSNAELLQAITQHIVQSTAKLEQNIEKTNQRLDKHIQQSDQTHIAILGAINQLADSVEQRFQSVDKRFDEILTIEDSILTIVKEVRDDHSGTIAWLKRHDQKNKEQDQEIKKMKSHLQLALS